MRGSSYTAQDLLRAEQNFSERYEISSDRLPELCALRENIGRSLSTNGERLVAWTVAPVLVGFAEWLAGQTLDTARACGFAVMRDGYMPARLVKILSGVNLKMAWFNRDTSMRAAFGCGDDEALLNWLVRTRRFPMSKAAAAERLIKRPYTQKDGAEPLSTANVRSTLAAWQATGLIGEARAVSAALAERLFSHWRSLTAASGANCSYFVDLACAGNVQRSVQTVLRFFNDQSEIEGLNFATTKGADWAKLAGCKIRGFLAEDGQPHWFTDLYSTSTELLEIFAAKPAPPLSDYSQEGHPIFDDRQTDRKRTRIVDDTHRLIETVAPFYKRFFLSHDARPILRSVWGRFLAEPHPEEIQHLIDWPLDGGLDPMLKRKVAARNGRWAIQSF